MYSCGRDYCVKNGWAFTCMKCATTEDFTIKCKRNRHPMHIRDDMPDEINDKNRDEAFRCYHCNK